MKNVLILLLLLPLFLRSFPVSGQPGAGKTTILFKGADNAAVMDLKLFLKNYNAGTIEILAVPLNGRTGQEFYLSASDGQATIKYTTSNSLENAVYTYLDLLGFRWYGPGDNWFIKPAQLKRLSLPGKCMSPSFRNRSFFGTGGLEFGATQPYDSNNDYRNKWYAWKRRNRFNADFAAVGHTGNAFYAANNQILDAHPEWFAGTRGKQNGRLKIDQPGAVSVYKNWVRSIYDNAKTPFIALGVDPEDGRGGADDPLPQKMAGIKNHADKWWWLANEVAKDYPENDKQVVVTAYAYGDGAYNALAPSFPLRKNVYPVIIPYAFQKAYQPNEMIRTWANKVTGNMGIYDYWNITQWSGGMPQFNINSIPEKLVFWKQNKIDGIYLETTDAAGPMGHALWLAGQLQWNADADFEKLYNQYLTDCFGRAAPAMKKMYDRWSSNYQGAAEVSFSLNDLAQASVLVEHNSPEWRRINEIKAYVHFMKLYYEFDGTQESKTRVFKYMYRIHHLMMVQTAAFIGQGYIASSPTNITPNGNGTKPLTAESARVYYTVSNFAFDFGKVKYLAPMDSLAWRFGGVQAMGFFRAPFTGTFQFDAGAEYQSTIKVVGDEGTLVNQEVGTGSFDYKETLHGRTWSMKRFKIQVKAGQTYYLNLAGGFNRLTVKTPNIVLFKIPGREDFDNFSYPTNYFYVPKGVAEIVFQDPYPEGTNGRGYLYTPIGKPLKRIPTGAKDIYKVVVEPQYRGKVWAADFGHPVWSFKNIPNITSLQKFDYKEN